MEKLWYNLSPDVVENMIYFSTNGNSDNCPKFIFEIEAITQLMNRYLLNLIDGTGKSILCVTSAEYSKTFPNRDELVGKIIRIHDYLLFQIEPHINSQNMDEFQYVIMILNAEILKLSPVKSIASLKRAVSKTPRIRGIVDSYFDLSNTNHRHNNTLLHFRLNDNTGSIGCTVSGSMSTILHSLLQDGVKLEVSHAMIKKVHPKYKICDNDFELELNQFSVLNIYKSDDLSLLYTHSMRKKIKAMLRDNCLSVNSSSSGPLTIPKISNVYVQCQQKCKNGKTPIAISSLTNIGISNSWIRGIVEYHAGIAKTRINTCFTRFHIRDHSAVIHCTAWEPICTPLNSVLKNGMIVEISDIQVKPTPKAYKISDHDCEIFVSKYSSINVLTSDKESLVYQYTKYKSTITQLAINSIDDKSSSKSTIELKQKYINGSLPVNINSLTKEGFCSSWLRGIVKNQIGLTATRINRVYMRFYIHDNTGVIHCTVWEPICTSLNRILEEGMIIEIVNYKVSPIRNKTKICDHNYEIYLNEFTSVRIFNIDNKMVYEYLKK